MPVARSYTVRRSGTGPFEFVERKIGSHVLYKRVENHWRQTPEFKELEFRWVPEDVTRLATLLSGKCISPMCSRPAKRRCRQRHENHYESPSCHHACLVFWRPLLRKP